MLYGIILFTCMMINVTQSVWNGNPADQDVEAPFAVAVTTDRSECTGVIIDFEWVLTSAHCFGDKKKAEVLIGVDSLNQTGEKTSSYEVIIHPEYDVKYVNGIIIKDTDYTADLALIRIHDPVLNPRMVISLASEEWPQDMHDMYWRNCTVIGYGQHSTGESGVLRKRSIHVGHGSENCACFDEESKKVLICEPLIEEESLCRGDSGGPLVCDNKLVGIAQGIFNVRNCDRHPNKFLAPECGEKHALSTYLYLCPYLDWIKENVKTTPAKPESCMAFKQEINLFLIFVQLFAFILFRGS